MPRERIKPDLEKDKIGLNPFIAGLTVFVIKKKSEVINKFGNADVIESDLEATPYTKVFMVEAAKKQVVELPLRSKELYLYVLHTIDTAKDIFWIDKAAYMKQMDIKSVNTYKLAVRGLCDGLYIYPHQSLSDVFWINPHFFFKGSRINKYPDNIKVKDDKKDFDFKTIKI